ncbi:hypothetical protein C0993_011747 [Termitomyces sp. T159_Od127]|nr:hypothetical protein C0993_011747 [Termitomyces sp. T159_Od127]
MARKTKSFRIPMYRPVPTLLRTSTRHRHRQTAEELKEEDHAAHSAKLQELIQWGTPRDLAAAQELMKALAGVNPNAKPDHCTQALTELNKLKQKVILLNEMLNNFDMQRSEQFAKGDVYDKWILDAQTDNPESLDTFLQMNDQINAILSRYKAYKKSDSSNPIPAEYAASAANGFSLITFNCAVFGAFIAWVGRCIKSRGMRGRVNA